MAKKSSIEKQKRREQTVKNNWAKRSELRQRAKNAKLSDEERDDARLALNKMRRDTNPIRLRTRCQFTGRARGVLSKFKISRLCFREMASMGLIPGVTKSSW
ncbi:MAG: 30S ribosomal protein S14 [Chlamydiia bacterium]|nr:30S ribosomal protein S14 [Chlamydiia bacterium]